MSLVDSAFILFNSVAGISILLIISSDNFPLVKYGGIIKIALWIGSIGLIVQALRTFYKATIGSFPFDDLPIWMLKDFSFWVLAVGLYVAYYKNMANK